MHYAYDFKYFREFQYHAIDSFNDVPSITN